MKIEIWSDLVCPFCYIGKTKFEAALNQFSDQNNIEIEWKSYQLMPELITDTSKNIDQILSETKGISLDQAKQMNDQAAKMGKNAGLEYNFEKAIVANTLKAHQLLHFAKVNGKQSEAEGLLFKGYFTDGKNIDDIPTLVELGSSIGLDTDALKAALENNTYVEEVRKDIIEAQQIGVRGVPFFVFNRKYAISGAQSVDSFKDMLKQSYDEWKTDHPEKVLEVTEGSSCSSNKECN